MLYIIVYDHMNARDFKLFFSCLVPGKWKSDEEFGLAIICIFFLSMCYLKMKFVFAATEPITLLWSPSFLVSEQKDFKFSFLFFVFGYKYVNYVF